MFEAARRSRACAYLADDDHGPLALQEILLAGCPVLGVRTGAPFIQDGVTGVFVDRLPPGAECVKNDQEQYGLERLLLAVQRACCFDRGTTRAESCVMFDTRLNGDRIVSSLQLARSPAEQ